MTKNYYEILGIQFDSDISEIKRAFRRIAFQSHPDKGGSGELFKDATEAYEILINPDKRNQYDKHVLKIPDDRRHRKTRQGTSLIINLKIKPEELLRQEKRSVTINRKGKCQNCNGTGSTEKRMKRCPHCRGSGIDSVSKVLGMKKNCKICGGYGDLPVSTDCPNCEGSGTIQEKLKTTVNLSPLIRTIVLPDCGNFCLGGSPGDLIVKTEIEEDTVYILKGLNIERVLQISPAQAILGDNIEINLFGKMVLIKIPEGTQEGHFIEKKNEGFSYMGRKGDLKIKIKIDIPRLELEDNEEMKNLYNQILKLEKEELWRKALIH